MPNPWLKQFRFEYTNSFLRNWGSEEWWRKEGRGIDHPERKHEERERARAAASSSHVEVGEKIGFARTNEGANGAKGTHPLALTHPSLNPFGRRQETELRSLGPHFLSTGCFTFCAIKEEEARDICFSCQSSKVLVCLSCVWVLESSDIQ